MSVPATLVVCACGSESSVSPTHAAPAQVAGSLSGDGGDADVLLMDEVLAVGDAEFQDKCFDVFARYRREGKTIVLVTHDLGSVEQYCDRAILIESGVIVADGNAGEVTRLYKRNVAGPLQSQLSELV